MEIQEVNPTNDPAEVRQNQKKSKEGNIMSKTHLKNDTETSLTTKYCNKLLAEIDAQLSECNRPEDGRLMNAIKDVLEAIKKRAIADRMMLRTILNKREESQYDKFVDSAEKYLANDKILDEPA